MDPHAADLAPVTSFLNNVYEELVRRGPTMEIEPSLATAWEPLEAEPGWRFHLRESVIFHAGAPFTADDVRFSHERAISEQSDVRSWFAPVTDLRVVDESTVEVVTEVPNPIFPESIANWMIMDRAWAEANVAHAVDVEAIDQVLMSGLAEPASQLIPAGLSGYSEANSERPDHDPVAAEALLAEAGHEDGFAFFLRCTNDRYLNDESVCQAITGMLQRVGLDARLETGPVRTYWNELREGEYDVFLLGWSPGTFDAEHPLRFLAHTPGDALGTWNFGGYSNERIDELIP
jgi:ABC-type transport system substrate-binding protein